MRLWIDDVREMPEDYDIHAKTAQEAIQALETGNITHVSFDHDLGVMYAKRPSGVYYAVKDDQYAATGYDVACWLEYHAWLGDGKPVSYTIHSANPVGAKGIQQAMLSAERGWASHGKHPVIERELS